MQLLKSLSVCIETRDISTTSVSALGDFGQVFCLDDRQVSLGQMFTMNLTLLFFYILESCIK